MSARADKRRTLIIEGGEPEVEASRPEDAPAKGTSRLVMSDLADRLARSHDPIVALADMVRDVRHRAAHAAGTVLPPSELEAYLATRLEEAGVLDESVALPPVVAMVDDLNHLFRLRTNAPQVSYGARKKVLAIEAALNAGVLAEAYYDDANDVQEGLLVRFESRVMRSVQAQAYELLEAPDPLAGPFPDGEWAVRERICSAVGRARLPFRITARLRANLRTGDVALEVDLPSHDLMGARAYAEGLGIVPATGSMRRRAMCDYWLRTAMLLAGVAFGSSKAVRRVWVAGVQDTPTSHSCLFSATLYRADVLRGETLTTPRLFSLFDARGTLDEADGELAPVRQTFLLNDRRFCPAMREAAPELLDRPLPPWADGLLGCGSTAGLARDSEARLTAAAERAVRGLAPSIEDSVRAVLAETAESLDPTVRAAGTRVVGHLIDGTLEDDPETFLDDFVHGDDLSRALRHALETRTPGRRPGQRDEKRLLSLVTRTIEDGTYEDAGDACWRWFPTGVDRVLYNVTHADDPREVRLAPLAWPRLLSTASSDLRRDGRTDEALRLARKAAEVSPMGIESHLALSSCLRAAGLPGEARRSMCGFLELAHDPESLALAYADVGYTERELGHGAASQACLLFALRIMSFYGAGANMAPAILSEIPGLLAMEMTGDEAEAALREWKVPVAPTERVSGLMLGGLVASLDAEVFPVAREFLRDVYRLSRQPVFRWVFDSLDGSAV